MTLRKTLFWTHLVVGVGFSALFILTCVSGALLSFEPQIVEWAERDVRRVPDRAAPIPRLDLEALLAQLAQKSPEKIPTNVTWNADPLKSVIVRAGREGTVFVNPYTADIIGKESKTHEFMHWVEDGHRWLWNRDIGKPITGAAALAFLGLAISGVYLWWPARAGEARPGWPRGITLKKAVTFKWNLTGKARDWNWHTVAGFWLSIYIVMLSTTGAIMSYTWASNLLYTLTGNPKPPASGEARQGRPAQQQPQQNTPREKPTMPSFDGLNSVITQASNQVPQWKSISMRIPPKADVPVSAFVLHEGVGWAGARSQITVDRKTGEMVKWEPYEGNNLGRKLRIWATNLHTGRALGWLGHSLNLMTALGGLLLIWTGLALTWRRFKNRKRPSA